MDNLNQTFSKLERKALKNCEKIAEIIDRFSVVTWDPKGCYVPPDSIHGLLCIQFWANNVLKEGKSAEKIRKLRDES